MAAYLCLGVIPHTPQRFVHGVLAHGFPVIVVTRKHQIETTSEVTDFLQHLYSLSAERYQVWSAHLGATMGVLHTLNSHPFARDFPHQPPHVYLSPASEAELAGADEHQHGQLHRELGQAAPAVGIYPLEKLR
ncbi:hypothetical protein D3C78_1040310 [compost metagenome]